MPHPGHSPGSPSSAPSVHRPVGGMATLGTGGKVITTAPDCVALVCDGPGDLRVPSAPFGLSQCGPFQKRPLESHQSPARPGKNEHVSSVGGRQCLERSGYPMWAPRPSWRRRASAHSRRGRPLQRPDTEACWQQADGFIMCSFNFTCTFFQQHSSSVSYGDTEGPV